MTEFLDKLESIHKSCFKDNHWTGKDFEELQKSGAVVCASDGAIIAWRQVLDEVELLTICVLPEYQRTGIAEGMLGLMEKEVISSGAKKIFLEVSDSNEPAINLYVKAGFLPISRREKYYKNGDDALILAKEFSADKAKTN